MSAQEIAFGIVAAVGALSAIRMVTTENVVHGALYLVVTLAMVGGAYLLLAAEFVARHRHGERPRLQDYVERYPDLAVSLYWLYDRAKETDNEKG